MCKVTGQLEQVRVRVFLLLARKAEKGKDKAVIFITDGNNGHLLGSVWWSDRRVRLQFTVHYIYCSDRQITDITLLIKYSDRRTRKQRVVLVVVVLTGTTTKLTANSLEHAEESSNGFCRWML